MRSNARLQKILRGMAFAASVYVCNAAPFLLEFRLFTEKAPGVILLEIPSLPVENGLQPLSYVRSFDVWSGPFDVLPDPPLMITEINRNHFLDSGSFRELWSFRLENGQGASIAYSMLHLVPLDFGSTSEISGPGVFTDLVHEEVQGLFRSVGGNVFEVSGTSTDPMRLTVSEIPEPGSFALVCVWVLSAASLCPRRGRLSP